MEFKQHRTRWNESCLCVVASAMGATAAAKSQPVADVFKEYVEYMCHSAPMSGTSIVHNCTQWLFFLHLYAFIYLSTFYEL